MNELWTHAYVHWRCKVHNISNHPSWVQHERWLEHCCDVIMGAIASQITSLTIVYSTVYSDADQRKHQSSVSLVFVRGIHRGPVNSPHKWPVTREMFPFDDVMMNIINCSMIMLKSCNSHPTPPPLSPIYYVIPYQIARFMGPTLDPIWGRQDPGGSMLALWTLVSGMLCWNISRQESKCMSSGSHCWGHNPGTLSSSEVSASHWKTGYTYMKSTGTRSSNELHWLDYMIGFSSVVPVNATRVTYPIESAFIILAAVRKPQPKPSRSAINGGCRYQGDKHQDVSNCHNEIMGLKFTV